MNENAETKKRIKKIAEKLSEAQKETKQLLEDYHNKKIYLKIKSETYLKIIDTMVKAIEEKWLMSN